MSPAKRKRGDEAGLTPIRFSFDLSRTAAPEDGSSSPSSRVAHKFRGLDLEGGGTPVPASDTDVDVDVDADAMRKRQRPDEMMLDAPQPHTVAFTNCEGKTVPQPEVAMEGHDPDEGSLQRSYPSINRLTESKSRSRRKKRAGSPPLRRRKPPMHDPSAPLSDDDTSSPEDEVEIVEPVRAALTWHEHEITVYDPEDEDDDGTGINGVGFKPTPALAHARAMKRRRQMAEYKKREESEARARRSERRGGASAMRAGPEEPEVEDDTPARKVRFTDGESQNMAVLPISTL